MSERALEDLTVDIRNLADELGKTPELWTDDSLIHDAEVHAGHIIAERLYRIIGDLPNVPAPASPS